MTDDTAVALAALKAEMVAATDAIKGLSSTIASDSQRNTRELADLRSEIAGLRLRMAEHYATTAALERFEERSSDRHRFTQERIEAVALRVNDLEDEGARQQGVTLGVKTFLAAGTGLIAAAAGVAAVVTALLG